jgi:uncharacterized protein YtpQ (UPF0354 family)
MLNKLVSAFVPPVSHEKFTSEAVAFIHSLGQNLKVEVTNPLLLKVTREDSQSSDFSLENAYLHYLNNRLSRKNIIAHFTLSLLNTDTEATLLPKDVIPTIKDRAYLTEIRAHLASKGSNPDEFFVHEDLNEELVIVYAVDSPTSIRYLNPRDLAELNLQGESLRSFAVRNLQQIMPPVEIHGKAPFLQLKAGGMFESALLLFERVWNKKELGIMGEVIVAVPSRETLLVADGSNPKAVAQLEKAAREMSASAAYRLTPKLFVRRLDKFEVYQPDGS